MEQNTFTSKNLKDKLNLYTKLVEISAIRFHEIKFSGNIYLVDKEYEEEKLYSQSELIIITEAWNKLYDEYFKKTDDTRFRKDLKHKKQSLGLLLEINILNSILSALESLKKNEDYVPNESLMHTISSLGNSLKKINPSIRFDSLLPLQENIENVKNYVGGLQSRYEILFKEDLQVEEKDISLYYEITIQIARVLKMDYIPDHINMLQYIEYEKAYKRQVKHEQQQHQRKQAGRRTN